MVLSLKRLLEEAAGLDTMAMAEPGVLKNRYGTSWETRHFEYISEISVVEVKRLLGFHALPIPKHFWAA